MSEPNSLMPITRPQTLKSDSMTIITCKRRRRRRWPRQVTMNSNILLIIEMMLLISTLFMFMNAMCTGGNGLSYALNTDLNLNYDDNNVHLLNAQNDNNQVNGNIEKQHKLIKRQTNGQRESSSSSSTSSTTTSSLNEDKINQQFSEPPPSFVAWQAHVVIPHLAFGDLDDANPALASEPFDYKASMPLITKSTLGHATKSAAANVSKLRDTLEVELMERGDQVMEIGSSGWLANALIHRSSLDHKLLNLTKAALISEETTRQLTRHYGLTWLQTTRGLSQIDVYQTPHLGIGVCPRPSRQQPCAAGSYRSLSGHCNNVQIPDLGAALTSLVRYAPARYADHVSKPIKSARAPLKPIQAQYQSSLQQFNTLPSSRAISIALRQSSELQAQKQHTHLTSLLSFFGQQVANDMAHSSHYLMAAGPWTPLKCCHESTASSSSSSSHPECMPIELNGYCLDYVRSLPAPPPGCNLGARDQLNLVSSFLDASWLYGNSPEMNNRLRAFSGGRLRSTANSRGELLPLIKSSTNEEYKDTTWSQVAEECQIMAQLRAHLRLERSQADINKPSLSQESGCFESGDTRVNDNIGLTLMHTIWLREHNQLANKLSKINVHWQDEKIFQEARRLVIAQFQHITYNELVPALLGFDLVQRFNLTLQSQGYSQAYEPLVNPATSNEFALTFSTFIKSIIPGHLNRYGDRLEQLGSTQTIDTFMNGAELFKNKRIAEYLNGMISQNAMEPGVMPMATNKMMTMDLDNEISKMTSNSNATAISSDNGDNANINSATRSSSSSSSSSSTDAGGPRVDLIALSIQQARDHGLRGYLYWREACHLKPHINSWRDLQQVLEPELVERLSQVYQTPAKLDLYIAQLEPALAGATVGPTLSCIFARQFYHTKHGDRYWYENDLPIGKGAFSQSQLDEIRQTSLARILCRNSQFSLSFIQPSPLLSSDSFLNAYQYCTNRAMSGIDLSKWREPFHSASQLDEEKLMNLLGPRAIVSEIGDDRSAASIDPAPTSLAFSQADTTTQQEPPIHSLQNNNKLRSNDATWFRGSSEVAKRMSSTSSLGQSISVDSLRKRLNRARRQLDDLAYVETRRLRILRESGDAPIGHSHAGYRYLGRPKRQTLLINNQSLILELATNDLVRGMLNQGKDREDSASLQSDVKHLLQQLETLQLDQLVANSQDLDKLREIISQSNAGFLTNEQRVRLAQANDSSLGPDITVESALAQTNFPQSTSNNNQQHQIALNQLQCQDDERVWPCDHTTPFRTITGWCNNLNEPKFGQSFTQHDRLLSSAYEDGLSEARHLSVVTFPGSDQNQRLPLPSPRLISTRIHDDKSRLHARYSLALMQFGQFAVDHDLTRTPFAVAIDGSIFDCSACNSRESVHRDCMPILIPESDSFHHQDHASGSGANKKRKCLHFIRSLNGQSGIGPRQQLNALTSYLDGSEIYGSDNCEAKSLRSFQGGRLNSTSYFINSPKLSAHSSHRRSASDQEPAAAAPSEAIVQQHNKDILPLTKANPECVTPNGFCFHAGDQRASEQPGLTGMHTLFMRYHNYIVGQLAQYNRHWNDERLYQQGRRILGAILQRVTYNEFLPRLLGFDLTSRFDLQLRETGYSNDYDDSCSASTLNEFSAAAFRMGHSLIRASFPLLDKNYKQIGKSLQLRKVFFNSQRIMTEPQLIDSIMRGIVSTPIESLDSSVTEELTNHLFEKPNQPFSGMDLVALNIQRARDHGIAGYNKYRVRCNLTKVRHFHELNNEIPTETITRLQSIYAHVDDIDLFTGGMSELPVHGGLIGPTLGCIIGLQFQRLKRCDRFWHETDNPWTRFSPAQLAEIRKSLLSKIICSQSDSIDLIQKNVMDLKDNFQNPRVTCNNLPTIDFSVWKENTKTCSVDKQRNIRIDLGQSKRVNPCKSCTCTLEGPVCRTIKIDCVRIMRQSASNLAAVMSDKWCAVQCAWALEMPAKNT